MGKKSKYVYDRPRPMVTVDAIVFTLTSGKAKVLLIRRKNEPFKGQWALPGGFVGIDEELAEAVARELSEETSLCGVALEQLRTFGKCGRDPRGRQITVAYMGLAKSGKTRLKAADDACEAKWFDINNLPLDLAFDHNEVLRFAIGKLKKKKVYQLSSAKGKS